MKEKAETILVVSHSAEERDRLATMLRQAGHAVRVASTAAEALDTYSREPAAVVVADRDLPGADGRSLANQLVARDPDASIVVVCSAVDVEDTVALMKAGAFHVLQRPVPPEHLQVVVLKALEHGRLSHTNRRLRSQLDISEKLAMIGRLASGVAHELNNPLDGVRRYVRMTQEGLDAEKTELSDYLGRAMSGLSRMTSIVRQLLTFSRNIVIENELENLRTMLEEVVRTLTPSGSSGATIELENPYVDIPVQRALFQVFVNLIKNALDAVETLGPRGLVRVRVRRVADHVEVEVEDNGVGVSPEDLRRVFEPFFTTKEVGRGTGLGLPISARIVERCGGTIRFESEKGKGTLVTVTLPLRVAAAAAVPAIQGTQR
ncbi:MAG: hybrid sensor histidine kinase/response regulator [Planctomycetes bacterium]|nr:hybrid sensor histidine kinase/response regulator [Planctomycetota bacterium]